MALREGCLWEHLTPGRPDRAALKGEVKVDVCVIGAGITGLSAAVHLLEQGKSVAVLGPIAPATAVRGVTSGWSTPACGFRRTRSKPVLARRWAASSTACWAQRHRWCSA